MWHGACTNRLRRPVDARARLGGGRATERRLSRNLLCLNGDIDMIIRTAIATIGAACLVLMLGCERTESPAETAQDVTEARQEANKEVTEERQDATQDVAQAQQDAQENVA